MTTLVRFSVLALALVGFSASTVVSHEQAAAKAGKLAPAVQTMNTCTPHGGCNVDY